MALLANPHHVGVVARDIETQRKFIHESMDVSEDSGIVHDPRQGVDLCLLQIANGLAIELVSGPKLASLAKRGNTYYHLCFSVPDIHDAATDLVKAGAMCVLEPLPAVLFQERLVAFYMTPIGLVELLEEGG